MASRIDRHASKIVGVLSCFDRVVIQGTIPSVCHAGAVATLLDSRDIRIFDYGPCSQIRSVNRSGLTPIASPPKQAWRSSTSRSRRA